jgi:ketosteroid isomerase-like protein
MKLACALVLTLLAGCGQVGGVSMEKPADTMNSNLEKTLWDVDQQWLCSGPYVKSYKDCVESRSRYWVDQFFEVVSTGDLLNKQEMVETQSSHIPANPDPRTAPYPDAFELKAVYGDFAMATDHTFFKTLDKSGNYTFSNSSKVLRLFVKDHGTWRPAAAGLVPTIAAANPAPPFDHSKTPKKSLDPQLEKQLAEIDRAWMDSSDMKRRVDYVSKLFLSQWFEILGWDPTGNTTKETAIAALSRFAETNAPPGVVADQFQLQAIFGDVALASDRRTRTWKNDKGQMVKTPHRSILVFVKQNGEWKSAGASLTPILAP